MSQLLKLGQRYRCPLRNSLRWNRATNECNRGFGTLHFATCGISESIVHGMYWPRISMGGAYSFTNCKEIGRKRGTKIVLGLVW